MGGDPHACVGVSCTQIGMIVIRGAPSLCRAILIAKHELSCAPCGQVVAALPGFLYFGHTFRLYFFVLEKEGSGFLAFVLSCRTFTATFVMRPPSHRVRQSHCRRFAFASVG